PAQVDLAPPAVLALGADEFAHVRTADIEGAHLRAPATAGGAHGEAHLVEDIHERQRAAGVRAGAGNERAARTQGAELVADAAAGLEGQAGLVDLAENLVHRVANGRRHGAVDGRGGGFVVQRAGVGNDAPGRDGAVAQRPEELLVPVLALLGRFHFRQGTGDTLPGVVHVAIDGGAILVGQAVLLRPNLFGSRLQGHFKSLCAVRRHRPIGLRHCASASFAWIQKRARIVLQIAPSESPWLFPEHFILWVQEQRHTIPAPDVGSKAGQSAIVEIVWWVAFWSDASGPRGVPAARPKARRSARGAPFVTGVVAVL